jgi:hypothetical protein
MFAAALRTQARASQKKSGMHHKGRRPGDTHLADLGGGGELLLTSLLVLLALLEERLRDLDGLQRGMSKATAWTTQATHRCAGDTAGRSIVLDGMKTRRLAKTHVVGDILGGILRRAREATRGWERAVTCADRSREAIGSSRASLFSSQLTRHISYPPRAKTL